MAASQQELQSDGILTCSIVSLKTQSLELQSL